MHRAHLLCLIGLIVAAASCGKSNTTTATSSPAGKVFVEWGDDGRMAKCGFHTNFDVTNGPDEARGISYEDQAGEWVGQQLTWDQNEVKTACTRPDDVTVIVRISTTMTIEHEMRGWVTIPPGGSESTSSLVLAPGQYELTWSRASSTEANSSLQSPPVE